MLIDFLSNDERAKESARILCLDRRYTVRSGFLFSSLDTPPDLLILPFPATRDGTTLSGTPYSLNDCRHSLLTSEKKPLLIGYGACPAPLCGLADYCDLSENEAFVTANAELTAEGGIYLIENELSLLGLSLSQTVATILGYGRIARGMAARLSCFGAHVLVGARRAEARKAAEEKGYLSFDCTDRRFFSERGRLLFADHAHILVNTVPDASVLEGTERMPKPLFSLELSGKSEVLSACQKLPYPTIDGKSIPTRFFKKTAGRLLAEAILHLIAN